MKNHPIIRACWFAVNVLMVVSLVAVARERLRY